VCCVGASRKWIGAAELEPIVTRAPPRHPRMLRSRGRAAREGSFELLLVNARHVKMVPGRNTDVKDCEWIAQLLEHGLLRKSFVPEAPMRELRELTRYRKILVEERAREANRVQKILETANIKLGDVATDVLGVSGRAMIEAMIEGERDTARMTDLAKRSLRKKRDALQEALTGRFTDHHGFLLRQVLRHVDFLGEQIAEYDRRIEEQMHPFAKAIERLDTIPGIARRAAEQIVAELGVDMGRFPTAAHAASWTGICPGNNESTGKRRSGTTPKGNRWLRTALVECAHGAVRKKDSYFRAQYHRLAPRRGGKRSIVAVAHSILVAAYHVLRHETEYRDLGPRHFDTLQHGRLTRYHARRLSDLGYQVELKQKEAAA
jgi:transposase